MEDPLLFWKVLFFRLIPGRLAAPANAAASFYCHLVGKEKRKSK